MKKKSPKPQTAWALGWVEIIEIWKRENRGGNIFVVGNPIAVLANNVPIYLAENFVLEKSIRSKEEVNRLKSLNSFNQQI